MSMLAPHPTPSKMCPNTTKTIDALGFRVGVTLWANTNLTRQKILPPFRKCCDLEACIKPPGASGFKVTDTLREGARLAPGDACVPSLNGTCHRGDQSVLSTILYHINGALDETLQRKAYVLDHFKLAVPISADPAPSIDPHQSHAGAQGLGPARCVATRLQQSAIGAHRP
jgi:hypothetical protein